MTQKTNFQKLKDNLTKEYKVVIIDEKSMTQRFAAYYNPLKVIWMTALFALIICIVSVILFTQTSLIRFLGPLPKSLVGEDYKNLAIRIDSLETLSQAREQKFKAIQNLITKGVNTTPDIKEEKQVESTIKKVEIPIEKQKEIKVHHVPLPAMSFIKPISGEITSKFDPTRYHYGIDLVAKSGSPILSVASGYILASGYTRENGYTVWIMHPQGFLSSYKHNSKLNVYVGQFVEQAVEIATIGNTGEASTGPHLHFELWKNNEPVDPDLMIKL